MEGLVAPVEWQSTAVRKAFGHHWPRFRCQTRYACHIDAVLNWSQSRKSCLSLKPTSLPRSSSSAPVVVIVDKWPNKVRGQVLQPKNSGHLLSPLPHPYILPILVAQLQTRSSEQQIDFHQTAIEEIYKFICSFIIAFLDRFCLVLLQWRT